MIKEFIGKGKTVEEATAAAKAGLNAPALASINVEVIQMPKKKTLGLFGGHDAEVRAWFDDGKSEKKPQPKKAPAKKAELKTEIFLQFAGKEFSEKELLQKVKEYWTKTLKNKVGDMKDVKLYVKPEESAVYYVINGDTTGKLEL